jgi:serine/threonine protein kinase
MGVPYDPSLDVWSIGCTLYELYTGKILFPGRSNNQMLLFMMELKGRFNSKMIKKAKFGDVYFDEMGAFESMEKDRVTGTVSNFSLGVSSVSHSTIRMLSERSTFRSLCEICGPG